MAAVFSVFSVCAIYTPTTYPSLATGSEVIDDFTLEVCMGMGKTGIPWVQWDSYGNGSKIIHGMGWDGNGNKVHGNGS